MKTFIALITPVIFLLSCNQTTNSTNDDDKPHPNSKILGDKDVISTYNFAVSVFYQGTDIPFYVPPDSIKPKIDYPDSLYKRGIFSYGNRFRTTTIEEDTFIVKLSESGYNVFSEALNEINGVSHDGKSSGHNIFKYVFEDSLLYQVFEDGNRYLAYDFPLIVGKSYSSDIGNTYTYTIEKDTTITTKAGTFQTFKIITSGHESVIRYISPEVGLVKSIKHESYESTLFDFSVYYPIDYYENVELVSLD